MTTSIGAAQRRDHIATRLRTWREHFANLSPKSMAILLQTFFSLAVLIPLGLLCLYDWDSVKVPELLIGVGLLVLATLSVSWPKPTRLPEFMELALPVVDLVALGLVRWATLPEGAPLSSLALGPALWLVVRFRLPGLVLGTAMIALTISAPSLIAGEELTVAHFARYGVLPLTAVTISVLVLMLFDRLSLQHRETRRSDRLLKGVINHLNVGVLVMDAHGNDVLMNPAQRSLHSIASPEGNPDPTEAGHFVYDMAGNPVPPQGRPARRVVHGETFDNEVVLLGSPDDDQRTVEITSRIVVSPDNNTIEARILIFDDMTAAYQAQRAQQEIIATVSHELRTPLTSILGYTDLAAELLEDLPAEDTRDLAEFLAVIDRNAERLLVRVEDLLLQQQTRYGTLKLEKRNVSLADLAREAAQAQRAVADDKAIDFTFEIPGDPQLRVDPKRITQVIDNILSNALKYTPTGGKVTMCVQSHEGTGVAVPEAVLSVTDTGPGLTPDEIEQVFNPFFRTQSASQHAEGTGLGLSVTKGIVEAHHGRVQVESQPGEGSTFSVYLPLREEYML